MTSIVDGGLDAALTLARLRGRAPREGALDDLATLPRAKVGGACRRLGAARGLDLVAAPGGRGGSARFDGVGEPRPETPSGERLRGALADRGLLAPADGELGPRGPLGGGQPRAFGLGALATPEGGPEGALGPPLLSLAKAAQAREGICGRRHVH